MSLTSVIVCPNPAAIASRALDLLVSQLADSIRQRGEGHLALTGGSSATALYRLLRSDGRARRVDWERVHAWQGDERFVPHDDPESNWGLASREWLDHAAARRVTTAHRHPIPVDQAISQGHDPAWAATRYARELRSVLPRRLGMPAFDVILLGLGGDTHVLSAFPGSPALLPDTPLAMAVPAPEHIAPHLPRVTLGPALLQPARLILVMVPGAAKKDALARVFREPHDPLRVPAQLALRPSAVWLLDAASAEGLRGARLRAGGQGSS